MSWWRTPERVWIRTTWVRCSNCSSPGARKVGASDYTCAAPPSLLAAIRSSTPPTRPTGCCLVPTSSSRFGAWNMADGQIVDRIDRAYIRPIRTVLAIDDEFPEYGNDPEKKDLRRAKAL